MSAFLVNLWPGEETSPGHRYVHDKTNRTVNYFARPAVISPIITPVMTANPGSAIARATLISPKSTPGGGEMTKKLRMAQMKSTPVINGSKSRYFFLPHFSLIKNCPHQDISINSIKTDFAGYGHSYCVKNTCLTTIAKYWSCQKQFHTLNSES